MIKACLDKYRDLGLLILRVGIGLMFIGHGMPKIMAGPHLWTKLGMAMTYIGINFAFPFWGFMAAFSEAIGGILIILGLFFRPACILLTITMAVAGAMLIGNGKDFIGFSQPIEDGIVFLSLIFIGAGKYSLDEKFNKP